MKILKSITNALTKAEEKRGQVSVATVRQDVVRRAIERGEFELIKCAYHMTDDYAWDAVNNFGYDKDVTKESMAKEYSILTPSCWVDPVAKRINGIDCYEVSIQFHSNLAYDMYVPIDGKTSNQVIEEKLVGETIYVGTDDLEELAVVESAEIYQEPIFEHSQGCAGQINIKYPNSEKIIAHAILFEDGEDWKEDGFICTKNLGYKGGEREDEWDIIYMSEMLDITKKHIAQDSGKLYKRYDIQDKNDFAIETLSQMKQWLADFWDNNPDEEMDEEEHQGLIEEIWESDEKELFERLAGIDYTFEAIEEIEEAV
jgi:hypothetical protein